MTQMQAAGTMTSAWPSREQKCGSLAEVASMGSAKNSGRPCSTNSERLGDVKCQLARG